MFACAGVKEQKEHRLWLVSFPPSPGLRRTIAATVLAGVPRQHSGGRAALFTLLTTGLYI
jgi:hypothetical protein